MSESVPAWKKAIYERKKQQQKEEELKQAEKEAHLASLPPWKRSLLLKKEAGGTVTSSQQSTTKSTAKPTAKQQTPIPSAATQNKSPTTVGRAAPTAERSAPAWKRKESPSSTNDSAPRQQQVNAPAPVNTNNNNNSDKSPAWNRKFAPAISTDGPSHKETSTVTQPVVNGTDNIPLWKRNLLKRQSAAATANTTDNKQQPVNVKATDTPQTSIATGKLSNIETRPHPSRNDTTNRSSSPATNTATTTTASEFRSRAKSIDDYNDERLVSLPQWKRDLILRKRAAAAKERAKQNPERTSEVTESPRVARVTRKESMDKDKGWKRVVQKHPEGASRSLGIKKMSDNKFSIWEKKAAAEQSKLVKRSSQEVDPVTLTPMDTQPVQQETSARQEVHVNGPEKEEDNESAPPILRGKDPWAHLSEDDPQFKALPPWKQALILRRRGDIRRRSNPDMNIERDSGSTHPENTGEDEPDFAEVPAWKREGLLKRTAEKADHDEEIPAFDDPDMPEWKKEKLKKSYLEKKKSLGHSTSLPVLVSKKEMSHYQSDTSIPEWKKEAMKEKHSQKSSDNDIPEWKKEAIKEKQSLRKTDSDIPEWKKEKKQTTGRNDTSVPQWKKEAVKEKKDSSTPLLTSVRPLSPDDGSLTVKRYSPQPADETDHHISNHVDDDDDDDIPCTNIDDMSDSDESEGGPSSYDVNPDSNLRHAESTSSGYSSDNNNNTHGMKPQKVSKSILIIRKVNNPVSMHQCTSTVTFCVESMSLLFIVFILYFSVQSVIVEYHGMMTRYGQNTHILNMIMPIMTSSMKRLKTKRVRTVVLCSLTPSTRPLATERQGTTAVTTYLTTDLTLCHNTRSLFLPLKWNLPKKRNLKLNPLPCQLKMLNLT